MAGCFVSLYFDPLMILRWIYIRALSKYLYLKGFIVVSSFGSSNRIIFCCCAAIVVGVSRVHAIVDTVQLQLCVFFHKRNQFYRFLFLSLSLCGRVLVHLRHMYGLLTVESFFLPSFSFSISLSHSCTCCCTMHSNTEYISCHSAVESDKLASL